MLPGWSKEEHVLVLSSWCISFPSEFSVILFLIFFPLENAVAFGVLILRIQKERLHWNLKDYCDIFLMIFLPSVSSFFMLCVPALDFFSVYVKENFTYRVVFFFFTILFISIPVCKFRPLFSPFSFYLNFLIKFISKII